MKTDRDIVWPVWKHTAGENRMRINETHRTLAKTTLLGTLPGKTLILDLDQGTKVLKGNKANIAIADIDHDLGNLGQIFETLLKENKKLGYDNICLDTITELEKSMLVAYGKAGKNDSAPSLQHYNSCQFKLRDYMRSLRDLRQFGLNIIVTAWEMPLEMNGTDGELTTKTYPFLAKKLSPEICGLFDIVAHMELSQKADKKGVRFLRLGQSESIFAKDRIYKRTACIADAKVLLEGGVS